jgi:hypothetical protein
MSKYYFRYKVIYVERENDGSFDACGWILIVLSYILVVLTFPIAVCFCTNVSFEYCDELKMEYRF